MTQHNSDPYLWPGEQCLRNSLGLHDPVVLDEAVGRFAAIRDTELASRSLPGACDLRHLLSFRRALFRDVFDWAGQLRTCTLDKGSTRFMDPGRLQTGGHHALRDVAEQIRARHQS